jgi:DNA adenine methylase
MILRRLGNKTKIAAKIQAYFPPHDLYIEPFFGAGGMFFNKPLARHNMLNDIDSDVYNLFWVLLERKEELISALEIMPIHEQLFKHWKTNQETDPVRKAMRFLMLSNFGYMGKSETIRLDFTNPKLVLLDGISSVSEKIKHCFFSNCDFRGVFKKLSLQKKDSPFAYCDPPYLGTTNNYLQGFTEQDSLDLFDTLETFGHKWAMSEFDHPFILDQAKKRGLNIVEIGERVNMKNRRTEILVMNYKPENKLF